MLDSIKTLVTSKRTLVILFTALLDLLILLGLNLDPKIAELLAIIVSVLGVSLVSGISVSDHGKAMGHPMGTDHKGRRGKGTVERISIPSHIAEAAAELDDPG